MAQSVEHVIGNDEVISSILITSSKKTFSDKVREGFYFFTLHFFIFTMEKSILKICQKSLTYNFLCVIIYEINKGFDKE